MYRKNLRRPQRCLSFLRQGGGRTRRCGWTAFGKSLNRPKHLATHHKSDGVNQVGTECEFPDNSLTGLVAPALEQTGAAGRAIEQVERPGCARSVRVRRSTENERAFRINDCHWRAVPVGVQPDRITNAKPLELRPNFPNVVDPTSHQILQSLIAVEPSTLLSQLQDPWPYRRAGRMDRDRVVVAPVWCRNEFIAGQVFPDLFLARAPVRAPTVKNRSQCDMKSRLQATPDGFENFDTGTITGRSPLGSAANRPVPEPMFRAMKAETDGLPKVGRSSRELGVRIEGPARDLPVGQDGIVEPRTGECRSRSMLHRICPNLAFPDHSGQKGAIPCLPCSQRASSVFGGSRGPLSACSRRALPPMFTP